MKQHSEKYLCRCNDASTLIIDKIAASRIVAGLLLCSFFIFVAGYFLGKRNCTEETIMQTERTAFADQLTYAINTAYHRGIADDAEQIVDDQKNIESEMPATHQNALEEIVSLQTPTQKDASLHYQAYLFGGTKRAVTQFADRLQKKGIEIHVLQRSSKTAQGNVRHWYQAVTSRYHCKDELNALVATIKKIEKLKDIQIVAVR